MHHSCRQWDAKGAYWLLIITSAFFDYAVPELIKAGEAALGICFISAGDSGSGLQYDPENGYRDVYRHIWKQ